jgi:hypothetical protein
VKKQRKPHGVRGLHHTRRAMVREMHTSPRRPAQNMRLAWCTSGATGHPARGARARGAGHVWRCNTRNVHSTYTIQGWVITCDHKNESVNSSWPSSWWRLELSVCCYVHQLTELAVLPPYFGVTASSSFGVQGLVEEFN